DMNKLQITIKNAINRSTLVTETKSLRQKIRHAGKIQEIIGTSEAISRVKGDIELVAPMPRTRVLVTGPNGSGKELVARWIHEKSPRRESPIVEVNCAAIPAELIESELFGHEKGSFTSAVKKRIGKFEQAHNGTIFLDEIGDMSLSAQAKVLRALEENKITRVGGEKDINVDVRVIAATNKDLKKEIEKGNFREDLYHRLSVILIYVPPLNDRREDIPLLVDHFLNSFHTVQGLPKKTISDDAISEMQANDWSGNIRQLRNAVERLIIMTRGNVISKMDVQKQVTNR
ncbi:MAG TPA: sigma-54-dependent Fis family transcriptional regulator, partial [Saprospiraceae bacterium]|nr:sigma-54-dependent Fis family transcriptional regulator [Saprospiraceae bacterium]